MEEANDKLLLCVKCVLEIKDLSILSNVKDIPEIIKNVSEIYRKKKESLVFVQRPAEYQDLLSGKGEIMEEFNRHIEEEKRKTETFFDLIIQDITKIINEKKGQHLKVLDEQVNKFNSQFSKFERQLKMTFPTEEDLVSWLPCHEILEKRFQSFSDFSKLKEFIENLKEDLQEEEQSEEYFQGKLKRIYEHVSEIRGNKPHYEKNDQILFQLNNRLRQDFFELFKNKIILENPVEKISNFMRGSKIVTKEELYMIRKWLPEGQPFNHKLIYSSSRDGANSASFHRLCDGKNNTISLLKVIFDGSDKPCIIGGFLDAPWHSNNAYIESQDAFIFSITSDIKCPLPERHRSAAYGGSYWGPNFGGGSLSTAIKNKGQISTFAYVGVEKLVRSNSYTGVGNIEFQTLELEVYSLD